MSARDAVLAREAAKIHPPKPEAPKPKRKAPKDQQAFEERVADVAAEEGTDG